MCLHVPGSWIFFFWEKVRWLYACIQFFHVRLAGFILYSIFFYLSGCFSRERGRSLVDARYCSSALLQSLRTRAHFHFRSSPHFRRPSLLLFFSNEHFLFRLISSHLKLPLSMPQYHPTISVLLLTLQGVKSPLLLSSMFFLCHYCFVRFVRPVGRASFELSGNNRFSLLAALPHAFAPLCPHHTPTRFSEIFTRTNTYTQSYLFSPHAPGLTINSKCQTKRKSAFAPLLRASRWACSGRHGSWCNNCRTSCRHWGRACMYHFVQCSFHFSL